MTIVTWYEIVFSVSLIPTYDKILDKSTTQHREMKIKHADR